MTQANPPLDDVRAETELLEPSISCSLDGTLPSWPEGTLGLDGDVVRASVRAKLFAPETPSKIARFTVLRLLGSGGMGVVYVAHDQELDRQLAIKFLRSGVQEWDTRGEARLVREAQAMARLSHPNVVQVYEVGNHEGQVFLAMELVHGTNLREWLRTEDRPWQDVLAKLLQAGRGLAAAHRAGIVHRDFKPENVLLDDDGRVLVGDFGTARGARAEHNDDDAPTTDRSPSAERSSGSLHMTLTATGVALGTPAYMSPEQHLGLETDARSDQFGFCVALYEGFYGVRPFVASGRADLVTQAMERKYRVPVKQPKLPTRIRNAILRGLSGSPDERFHDMDALLRELTLEPKKKLWRMAMAGGAIGAMAVSASVFALADVPCDATTLGVGELWNDEQRRVVRHAIVQTELPFASLAAANVIDALDGYAAGLSAGRVDACRATAVDHVQSEQLLDARMRCLDRRSRSFRALVGTLTEGGNDAAIHAAEAVTKLPELESCSNLERLSQNVHLAAADPASEADVSARLAESAALEYSGKFQDAAEMARAALRDARATGHVPTIAEALFRLGSTQMALDDKAASTSFGEALSLAEEAEHDELVADVWVARLDLGARSLMPAVEAREAIDRATAWAKRLGDNERKRARVLQARGRLLHVLGDLRAAEVDHRDALEIRERIDGPDSLQAAESSSDLAVVLSAAGHHQAALELYERAFGVRKRLLGDGHPLVGNALVNLGAELRDLRRLDEGRVKLQTAVELFERTLGVGTAVAHARLVLGALEATAGRFDAARSHFETAAEIFRTKSHAHHVWASTYLARVLLDQKDYAAALPMFRECLALSERNSGTDNPMSGSILTYIGDTLLGLERLDEARGEYEHATRILERAHGPFHASLGQPLRGQALIWLKKRDPVHAVPLLERAIAVWSASSPTFDADLAETKRTLAEARRDIRFSYTARTSIGRE